MCSGGGNSGGRVVEAVRPGRDTRKWIEDALILASSPLDPGAATPVLAPTLQLFASATSAPPRAPACGRGPPHQPLERGPIGSITHGSTSLSGELQRFLAGVGCMRQRSTPCTDGSMLSSH
jgi:hypothetical protein